MSEKSKRRARAAAYLGQPYVKAVDRAVSAGAIATQPGTVGMVEVRHDSWCALLKGRGKCNCNPDLQLTYPPMDGAA